MAACWPAARTCLCRSGGSLDPFLVFVCEPETGGNPSTDGTVPDAGSPVLELSHSFRQNDSETSCLSHVSKRLRNQSGSNSVYSLHHETGGAVQASDNRQGERHHEEEQELGT